jgi:hypothetical protein
MSANPDQAESSLELMRRGLMAADERRKADQLELERRRRQCDAVIADYSGLMQKHQELKARYDDLEKRLMTCASEVQASRPQPEPPLIHIDHSGHVNFAIRWATMVAVILVAATVFCLMNPGHVIHPVAAEQR